MESEKLEKIEKLINERVERYREHNDKVNIVFQNKLDELTKMGLPEDEKYKLAFKEIESMADEWFEKIGPHPLFPDENGIEYEEQLETLLERFIQLNYPDFSSTTPESLILKAHKVLNLESDEEKSCLDDWDKKIIIQEYFRISQLIIRQFCKMNGFHYELYCGNNLIEMKRKTSEAWEYWRLFEKEEEKIKIYNQRFGLISDSIKQEVKELVDECMPKFYEKILPKVQPQLELLAEDLPKLKDTSDMLIQIMKLGSLFSKNYNIKI